MSDTETPDPNEIISITREDARKFHKAYEITFTTREELNNRWSDVRILSERITKLEAKATSLKWDVGILFLGLIVLFLFQTGYLGP